MPTLEKVTEFKSIYDFCLTDCGPSEGCNPDDYIPLKSQEEKQ